MKEPKNPPLSQSEQTQLETLIERLHQLFIESLDAKAFDLYIEPQVKDRETGVEYSAFTRLTDFITDPHAASLLLAGDPGMGKTLLSLQIAQRAWYFFIKENIGGLLRKDAWSQVLIDYYKEFEVKKNKEEKKSFKADNCLPLWMWMPFLRSGSEWRTQLLETYAHQNRLTKKEIELLKKACQLKICRLFPIMDGWDELPPGVVIENLYLKSGFWEEGGWPYLKVLSTCRPEAFIHYEKSQGDYRSIFHPKKTAGNYTILNLSPFESWHIKNYVERYLSTLPPDYVPLTLEILDPVLEQGNFDKAKQDWLEDYQKYTVNAATLTRSLSFQKKVLFTSAKLQLNRAEFAKFRLSAFIFSAQKNTLDWHHKDTYLRYLEQIRGLSELIKTPFILSAVVQVLPTIVLHEQRNKNHDISRYMIYQYFVDHWLTKQAARLWSDPEKRADLPEFRAGTNEASITKLKACLLTYSENLARLALNLGKGKINVDLTEEDTSHASLVIPPPGQPLYFAKELVEKDKIQLIRSGCLLKNIDNHFKFLHKSLVEYFAAKILFSGAHVIVDYYLHRFDENQTFKNLDLNDHLLIAEPSVIYLLADKAKEDMHFKYLLYQMIELSKGEPNIANAAANAITILNAAGESFCGRDFMGINIPGAILNGALCEHTDFAGANLSNVVAHNGFFQNANFSHAQMQGLDFRELPRIKHTSDIMTMCIALNGKWFLVGDIKGYVTQYSYPEGKQLRQWYRKPQSLMGITIDSLGSINPVRSLALHPDEKLAACGGIDGTVQLINVERGFLGVRFVPPLIKQATFFQMNLSDSLSMTFCSEAGRYLAFSLKIEFKSILGNSEAYERGHLQIWDIHQQYFLGEYLSDRTINELATCNQNNTLLAGDGQKVALFFIARYRGGSLIPTQILDCGEHFVLSRDERLLAVPQKNAIQIYRTIDFAPLDIISLQDEQKKVEALTFNHKGTLLVVRSNMQLQFYDLLSRQHLYALPIPEGGADIPNLSLPLHFISTADELRLLFSTQNILYFWLLSWERMNITYPRRLLSLSTRFLKKTKFLDALDTDTFSIKMEMKEEKNIITEVILVIHDKIIKKTERLSYQLNLNFKEMVSPKFALSANQAYLVTRNEINFDIEGIMAFREIDSFMARIRVAEIYVWDLKLRQLCWTATHPIPYNQLIFSSDGQWIVHGCKEVFIHQLEDGKLLLRLTIGSIVTALALTADNSWLVVADTSGSLAVFDVKTQQRLYRLSNLPILIRNLDLTEDSRFLVAKSKKDGALTFRIFQEKGNVYLWLIHSSMELNLTCSGIKIEKTQGLSKDNLQLLQQNDAQGTPVLSNPAEHSDQKDSTELIIPREVSFDRVVVKRSSVTSFLNPRAVLDYSLWQVGLVRNTASKNNREHTFIVVEGMDAFGHCFFWRFDLATKIGEEKVKEGFAKVVMNKRENILLSEREAVLANFLNPNELKGRGLESLVGHVWQLKREVVLQLYCDVQKDAAQELLPYAQTGNQSFFGGNGDSCYSWARRRLLALKQEKIEKQLPSKTTDYFAMVPSWKLTRSLQEQPAVPPGPGMLSS